jgi:Ca-activated chloride channel family protein
MSIADASPQFPGGVVAMVKFIRDSTHYPKMEMDSNIQGRVVVRFDVAIDGSIENIRIVKSISPGLDAEAVRVIRSMPKWIPPTWNGKKIRSV